jgi:hypothetical protein
MDVYEITEDDANQDIAETLMWAASEGKPLVVTLTDGRVVHLVPSAAT